jgi:hypothetical protein
LGQPPWDGLCTVHSAESTLRDWDDQSARQAAHVRAAIECARALGCTHLLHIDDDELLYLPGGRGALDAALVGATGADAPLEFHALTVEALAPSVACVNPFAECCAFRHCVADFTSYGAGARSHGKSLAVLATHMLGPCGPHHFCGPGGYDASRTHALPPGIGTILHYESCTFARWRDKFTDYARRFCLEGRSAVERAATFTPFYKASLQCCVRLLQSAGSDGVAAREAARRVWSDAKLEPPAVSACRPVRLPRALERLTLIPPAAAGVASDMLVAAADQALASVYQHEAGLETEDDRSSTSSSKRAPIASSQESNGRASESAVW